MEFNFKSYDNSKQSISYCEVDKCKAVNKLKKCLQEIKKMFEDRCKACPKNISCDECFNRTLLNKISECEGNDETNN